MGQLVQTLFDDDGRQNFDDRLKNKKRIEEMSAAFK